MRKCEKADLKTVSVNLNSNCHCKTEKAMDSQTRQYEITSSNLKDDINYSEEIPTT